MSIVWRVQLTDLAALDLIEIRLWTTEKFGKFQAANYIGTITSAIETLLNGPEPTGSKPREDLGSGIRTLHVKREGNKGRQITPFRFYACFMTA
jgi:plasmid stabilization system protein ParE